MKKLFLASNAFTTIDLISPLLPKPATELSVAFISTAANPFKDTWFVLEDRDKLVDMGFTVFNVDLEKIHHEALETELQKADIVFVAGGDTFYLLDYVRKSGFDVLIKKLIENGVIYVGSSAGTVLCCPTIEAAKRFDDPSLAPDLSDYSGLNLVEKILIPHAQEGKYLERRLQTAKEMEEKGYEVLALRNDEVYVVEGDKKQVISL